VHNYIIVESKNKVEKKTLEPSQEKISSLLIMVGILKKMENP
jgi:hypothetical protein